MTDVRCRRCLLREAFPADYAKYVASLLAGIPAREKAVPALYEARLSACRACDQRNNGTCMGCGCLVELRAAYRREACPFQRWPDKAQEGRP